MAASKFLEMALKASAMGMRVHPLHPKSKKPVSDLWPELATTDAAQIGMWAAENEDYNCGVACFFETTLIVDVDDMEWFRDEFPEDLLPCLKTFAVKTSKGIHYHFSQTDLSRAKLKNLKLDGPKYVNAEGKPVADRLLDVIVNKKYGVMAGSTHPKGPVYETWKDLPLLPVPDALVDWLVRVTSPKAQERVTTAVKKQTSRPVRDGLDFKEFFNKAGLRYDALERDGKLYLNYHVKMGKCLSLDGVHGKNATNNECCAFGLNLENREPFHFCQACGTNSNLMTALANLGVKPEALLKPWAGTETWTPIIIDCDTVQPEHMQFLWEPYLPEGKLIHFGGNSAEGKSPVTLDLLARVTAGLDWPDGQKNPKGPKVAVLLNIEDDLRDTIIPRFKLMAGDTKGLKYLKGTKREKDGVETEFGTALDRDWDKIELALDQYGEDLALVVIDPITNYLGAKKMNAEEEVRSILTPIAMWAERTGVTVITVGHFNRREKGTTPLHRVMGAAAFTGVSRAAYVFGPDPEAEEGQKHDHVMVCMRGAVGEGEGLRYSTVQQDVTWDGATSKVIKIIWKGKTSSNAEQVVDPLSVKDKTQQSEAAEHLKQMLMASGGRMPARVCMDEMTKAGFFPGCNTGVVRKKAGVQSEQKAKQHWWFLKVDDNTGPEPYQEKEMF